MEAATRTFVSGDAGARTNLGLLVFPVTPLGPHQVRAQGTASLARPRASPFSPVTSTKVEAIVSFTDGTPWTCKGAGRILVPVVASLHADAAKRNYDGVAPNLKRARNSEGDQKKCLPN